MEGLIIFIVMALLSFFFSGNKKEKNSAPSKRSRSKDGRLKDFMDDVKTRMEQFEDDTKPLSKRQEQAKKLAQQARQRAEQLAAEQRPYDDALTELTAETRSRATTVPKKQRIKSMDELRLEQTIKQPMKKQHRLLRNQHDLKRAVLLAEVLGPPKSKRK